MNNHNRRLIAWLITGVLAFCVVVAIAQTQNGSVKRFPHIEFGETTEGFGKLTLIQGAIPKDMPSQIRIYKVKPLASKKEAVLKLIRALPLTPGPKTDAALRKLERIPESVAQKEESFYAETGGWNVEVWSDGQFSIRKDERIDRTQKWEDIPRAPAPEKARKVADDFLVKIGLFMTEVNFTEVRVGDELIRGDKPSDKLTRWLLVNYSASIDNIPLSDAVSVRVGAGPAVVSMSSHLRQVVPDSMVPILSPQEAFDKLREQGHIGEGECASGNVTSIRLNYYLANRAHDIPYVMPVYIFKGEDTFGKRTSRWSAYVEAARPEYLENKPAKKSDRTR